jgi:hypothetical protein
MNPQTFANHTRWHAPFHFFLAPVMIINLIWSIVLLAKNPGLETGRWLIVSLALVVLGALVRTYPLRVQDRLIRLEERIRYQQLLPPSLLQQASALSPGQIVALRFAADDELAELLGAVVSGKLSDPKEIKRAITNWRSDTFRV